MASITAKKIGGHTYYYARRCQRVGGKPKIVWQRYLGRAEDIVAALEQATPSPPAVRPSKALLLDFGAVVALYDLAQRLRLVEHIDRHVPKERSGPSVGTYLLVAALNRCVAPRSKAAIGPWFAHTALGRLLHLQPQQLTSQRFWDNMDRVSHQGIEQIEADVVATLVKEFGVDLHQVLFDATNFFTFLDTFNQRSTLAQRGKSKQGRASLRLVGLALLVTTDSHLPLFHRTYPGNDPDAPTFASLIGELVDRCRKLTGGAQDVILIFDKGNNSRDNLDVIEDSPFHFVGSLVPTQHPDLLKIPLRRFRSLEGEGLAGVQAFRTQAVVFGVSRTVLVTFNENLFLTQLETLLREIAQRQQKLRELQRQLDRWAAGQVRGGQAPTLTGVEKKIHGWLQARHMKDLFTIDLREQQGLPQLHYRFNQQAWQHLQKTLLGKTLLFTDLEDATDAQIVRAYRSQSHIEDAFRTMKDPHHIALRPQYHWTDQKIEVHVFTCVLALMLASLLQRQLHARGLAGSIADLLDELGSIRQVGGNRPA
jgi:transposase